MSDASDGTFAGATIQSRGLVRVLAVAQDVRQLATDCQFWSEARVLVCCLLIGARGLAPLAIELGVEPRCNGRVVLCGVREGFAS